MEFDHLPLNIFAAGKIELILRTSSESEKEARLRILLMCVYHSQSLDINEITEQYDAIMKGIERGELFWADNLTDRLDRALDHRARVIDKQNMKTVKVLEKTTGLKLKSKKVDDKIKQKGDEETIYCIDFNRGKCTEMQSHLGRFGGHEGVLKQHICRVC